MMFQVEREMSDSNCLSDCSVLNQTTCQPVTRRQMVLDNVSKTSALATVAVAFNCNPDVCRSCLSRSSPQTRMAATTPPCSRAPRSTSDMRRSVFAASQSPLTRPVQFSVFLSVLMIIFGVVGLAGNTFSVVVLSRSVPISTMASVSSLLIL